MALIVIQYHFTCKIPPTLLSDTGVNNEPENNPINPDDERPVDIVEEHVGDSWNDAFRADFIFGPDNINRLDEIDRDGHDDANAGGFGRPGSSNNPYRAPPADQNSRKRPAAGSSGSSLMPSRKFRR